MQYLLHLCTLTTIICIQFRTIYLLTYIHIIYKSGHGSEETKKWEIIYPLRLRTDHLVTPQMTTLFFLSLSPTHTHHHHLNTRLQPLAPPIPSRHVCQHTLTPASNDDELKTRLKSLVRVFFYLSFFTLLIIIYRSTTNTYTTYHHRRQPTSTEGATKRAGKGDESRGSRSDAQGNFFFLFLFLFD
jgi:hypothetical protein